MALPIATLTVSSAADAVLVPADIQAELLSKLASYDRNFEARAGARAIVLLVVKPKNAQSSTSAATMKSALDRMDRIGGVPHREAVVQYDGAEALAKRCRADRASIGVNFKADVMKLMKVYR